MIKKFLLVSILLVATAAQAFEPFEVQDIRLEGAERISRGTIFTYLPIEKGDEVTDRDIKRAIRSLFRTGYFDDVKIAREGNILVVKLKERPAIARIEISGNKAIKTEDLKKGLAGIGLTEGEVYDELQLQRVKSELTNQYFSRGKYNVKVTTTAKKLDRNRVKINIHVNEGKPAKIKHINIVGNTVFTDEELTDNFESDTTNWLSWYSSDDQYSKEKLNGDLEKLRSYYQDRGYVDFDIDSVQVTISPDKKNIYLTINVHEGDVYKFGKSQVTGELILPKKSIEKLLLTPEDTTFSRQRMEVSAERIEKVLGNLGYAFAKVTPVPKINKEDRTVELTYFVDPGKRVYVRRINFVGNVNTKDEVLRREMRQFEGGWYSKALVDRSKIRLQQKPYFEEVEIDTKPVPGTEDQVDVEVKVKERNSGQFNFGLGYSQVSGLSISSSVSLSNVKGTGNSLSVAISKSLFFKRFNVFYENPYYTDDGVARGFSVNYSTFDYGEANIARFNSSNGGMSVHYSLPISEYDRVFTKLGYERVSLRAFPGITAQSIVDNLIELGGYGYRYEGEEPIPGTETEIRRSFTFYKAEARWSRDSRNRFFNPSRGSYHRLGLEVALPGSTAEFIKVTAKENKLFPLTNNLTLSLSADIGYGDGYGDTRILPFFENFYAGGVRSVRGYTENTLGPKSSIFDDDLDTDLPPTSRPGQPVGGAFKFVTSAELVFPTPFSKANNAARLAWFVDAGNVFRDVSEFEARELRLSTGIALKWQAPIGPIIINYAIPFNTDRYDRTERIQFAFGSSF